ncbi:MAG TPA: FKBP-type peptidyl-prolyl cis-trans isomerase [Pirellulales bacterium]|nr:FKBP-type peptidyl-prolyl cis-trans isomerase [Pirellulales bacterium]
MRMLALLSLAITCCSSPAVFAQGQGKKLTPIPRPGAAAAPTKVNTADASYAMGYKMGTSIKRGKVPVDTAALLKGIQEGVTGAKSAMSEEDMVATLKAFEQEIVARIPEQNKQEGEAFLAANAKAEGVKTTKSGLQYKVVKEGTGKAPTKNDQVTVHYRGTLVDGTPFDSSYDRGEPAKFPVAGVIPGWTEALQLMKLGSKYMLYIPADLAYGPVGSPPVIGPNSTLVFEVELLGIGE